MRDNTEQRMYAFISVYARDSFSDQTITACLLNQLEKLSNRMKLNIIVMPMILVLVGGLG